MKKSDVLLAVLVIVVLGLAFWVFTTGRFDSTVMAFIDGIWESIQGMVRPIFRR